MTYKDIPALYNTAYAMSLTCDKPVEVFPFNPSTLDLLQKVGYNLSLD
jgi:hypothetical protein